MVTKQIYINIYTGHKDQGDQTDTGQAGHGDQTDIYTGQAGHGDQTDTGQAGHGDQTDIYTGHTGRGDQTDTGQQGWALRSFPFGTLSSFPF